MIFGMLQFSGQVYAQESAEKVVASTDVEATMKSMSFTYRQAMQAADPKAMHSMVDKLQQLVSSVQVVQFEPKRQTILQQGLQEVQTQLNLVQQSLGASDIKKAKQQLQEVIALKKQYHKERSPSIWRLLFGSE